MPGLGPWCTFRHGAGDGTDAGGESAPPRCRPACPPSPPASTMPSELDPHPVRGDLEPRHFDSAALRRTLYQDRVGVVDVDQDTTPCEARKRRQRAAGPVDRHMPHATT